MQLYFTFQVCPKGVCPFCFVPHPQKKRKKENGDSLLYRVPRLMFTKVYFGDRSRMLCTPFWLGAFRSILLRRVGSNRFWSLVGAPSLIPTTDAKTGHPQDLVQHFGTNLKGRVDLGPAIIGCQARVLASVSASSLQECFAESLWFNKNNGVHSQVMRGVPFDPIPAAHSPVKGSTQYLNQPWPN